MLESALATEIEAVASRYPKRESALMPALDLVQRARGGCLSPEDVTAIADTVGVTRSKAHGVLTYYTMYNKKPVGKYHLQVDTNISATLMGALEILEHLKATLGIEVGGTTKCGTFTLSTVEDLGACGTCPVIQVNDRYYDNLTIAKVDELIASLKEGIMPDWPSQANYGTACNLLLKRRGKEDSTDINGYIADGGYKALEKALSMQPEAVVAEVKAATLRGRGGAGFPAGVKWGFLAKGTGKPTYLICNADEGEPGTFKDRQIMEYDPHLLIEGMAISAFAIGAKLAFIYIRGEFAWIADILDKAVADAKAVGKLGLLDDIIVHRGAGAYVCGEETALIESLEGKRGNPRLKPPFPAVEGLYGCPTIVNNVETLSCVPYIVENGAEAFKQIGTPNNFGPRIFGVSGHVNKPGAYEHPMGTPLKTIIEGAGGVKGNMKGVIVGGLSVPILTADEASDVIMDYDSCLKHGTMLGSAGVIVINDTASIPQLALRAIKFYAHESCGQCTPCRDGSKTVAALLKRLIAGYGTSEDIDQILSLCATIKGTTLCPTGEAFAMPIEAMVKKFRNEFEALVS